MTHSSGNHSKAKAALAVTGIAIATAVLAGGNTRTSAQDMPLPSAHGSRNFDSCSNLVGLHLADVQIVSAGVQAANEPVADARLASATGSAFGGPSVAGLPAFCRLTGSIHPEPGSDIRFELWMPTEGWDGRFTTGNNGGLAGSISYMDLASGVRAGRAIASTDTGHVGEYADGSWARRHPEKVRDYGWRAIHLVTANAKRIVAAFYGKGPDHSYFYGCSNGGRQALMEAARFPEDYDGVIVGAPAAILTDAALAMANDVQAQIAPGAAIRPEQASFLQSEVLRQCDALDGQRDGLIDDPRQCKLQYDKLACGTSSSPQCFTPPQLAALERIHRGAFDRKGRRVTYGFPATGAEVGLPFAAFGWDGSILASRKAPAGAKPIADSIMADLPQTPIAMSQTVDFDGDPARLKSALSAAVDTPVDLHRFFARGGKMIIWHGWADVALPPEGTIALHDAVLRASGRRADKQTRFFMVPGVQHCMGGPGPDVLGQIGTPMPSDSPERHMGAALQAWVETGRTPESIVGRRSMGQMLAPPGPDAKQRLICAYPARSVLKPGGDPDKAASYSCRRPI